MKSPSFSDRSQLARYIHPNQRMKGNRASSVAFLAEPGPPRETYLSVNSLEVEKLSAIASYYRTKFGDSGKVATVVKTVGRYNIAAQSAGLAILRQSGQYYFADQANLNPAYRHRPVAGKVAIPSPSHCGVEFIRALNGIAEAKFATEMVRERYQLL